MGDEDMNMETGEKEKKMKQWKTRKQRDGGKR